MNELLATVTYKYNTFPIIINRDDFPLTPKISDFYMKALYYSIFSKNQEVSIDVGKIACIHHTI
ncbi:hypothetical protein BpHYR1_022260 [Brachionus plicatilis]|uniref:Uncharacterized protein n=1 Tax=Brachionus plicatilis TaxID=10195 RepID=A0A3M7Q7D8_BRAPC|nr:hypothetical protein BpHYR1_022260 [Brachionus plicatilis]